MAPELFLSEELGPVTIIRAPPSPGYAGDWVKFNPSFSCIVLQFHATTSRPLALLSLYLECPPLSFRPLRNSGVSLPQQPSGTQCYFSPEALASRRSKSLVLQRSKNTNNSKNMLTNSTTSNLLVTFQHSYLCSTQAPGGGSLTRMD